MNYSGHIGRLKLGVLAIFFIGLSGCLEVQEDNAEIVAEMQEQNRLLSERSVQEREISEIVLYGRVTDHHTGVGVENFTVRVKLGPDWQDTQSFTGGEFRIEGMAPSSDFELLISSASGAFMDRVVYGGTRFTLNNESFQDLGEIEVAAPVEQVVSIKNVDTVEPVTGLELVAYSHVGAGSTEEAYAHRAVYDAQAGVYRIDIPAGLVSALLLNLDSDGDGISDYVVGDEQPGYEEWNDYLYVLPMQQRYDNIELEISGPSESVQDVVVNLTILDGQGALVSDAEPVIELVGGTDVVGVFSAETEQYTFSVAIAGDMNIMVPAYFSEDARYFDSRYVSISSTGESGRFYIGGNSSLTNSRYYAYAQDATLDLVMQLNEENASSELELVLNTIRTDRGPLSVDFFYSGGIALNDDSVKLYREDVLQIVRGNDSTDDLVLPGVTYLASTDVEEDATASLSLNNTLLSIVPSQSLTPGYEYRIEIDTITDIHSALDVNLSGDESNFNKSSVANFNIDSVVLDNNNYWTNGQRIRATTTAGIASTRSQSSSSCYVFLPVSIETLENFTLNKKVVTSNGVLSNDFRSFTLVDAGNVSPSLSYMVSTAYEEVIETGRRSIGSYRGTTLADGRQYALNVSEYLSDTTDESVNSILFEYVYETTAGELFTGEIELFVR